MMTSSDETTSITVRESTRGLARALKTHLMLTGRAGLPPHLQGDFIELLADRRALTADLVVALALRRLAQEIGFERSVTEAG